MRYFFIVFIIVFIFGAGFLLSGVEAPEGPIGDSPEIPSGVTGMEDRIRLSYPAINQQISSPLVVTGEARGNWYFEGDFPVTITNWDGLIIAEGYATAAGEWMTEDFVPFTATIEFINPSWDADFSKRGSLILQRNNPSGLPENDAALEIPVFFE